MPKPIFFIVVFIAVAIAVVYFYQKKGAEQRLDKLVNNGTITISERIEALPIVIIDATNNSLHLLAGDKHQAIQFAEINSIDLYQAADRGNNAGGQVGPDYATISTLSGERFRFDNLTLPAKEVAQLLTKYPPLAAKLKLNNSDR